MILAATIAIGMMLFQMLIAWEAYRNIRRDTLRWTTQVWFSNPKEERSFQRRQKGVQTL